MPPRQSITQPIILVPGAGRAGRRDCCPMIQQCFAGFALSASPDARHADLACGILNGLQIHDNLTLLRYHIADKLRCRAMDEPACLLQQHARMTHREELCRKLRRLCPGGEANHEGTREWPGLTGMVPRLCDVNCYASFFVHFPGHCLLQCLPYLSKACSTKTLSACLIS